jgi:hypothetical protein
MTEDKVLNAFCRTGGGADLACIPAVKPLSWGLA